MACNALLTTPTVTGSRSSTPGCVCPFNAITSPMEKAEDNAAIAPDRRRRAVGHPDCRARVIDQRRPLQSVPGTVLRHMNRHLLRMALLIDIRPFVMGSCIARGWQAAEQTFAANIPGQGRDQVDIVEFDSGSWQLKAER